MKQDNRGFSLVELLVAMMIMALLGSMLIISMGVIPRTNAKACANGLKTAIGQTRIMTMGKKQTSFRLKADAGDGKYYTVMAIDEGSGTLVEGEPELCGKSNVKVSYHLESSGVDPLTDLGAYKVLNKGDVIEIMFDRGSGKELRGGAVGAATLIDGILVEGGGAEYFVRVYSATGKVTLE